MMLTASGVVRVVVDRGFAEAMSPCADRGLVLFCIRLRFALDDLLTI